MPISLVLMEVRDKGSIDKIISQRASHEAKNEESLPNSQAEVGFGARISSKLAGWLPFFGERLTPLPFPWPQQSLMRN